MKDPEIAHLEQIEEQDRRRRGVEKINHPAHYGGDTTYEAIKVIEAWQLGFHLGSVLKYICRAGKKGSGLEDLKKARWYLDRQIEQIESATDRWGEKHTSSTRIKE